MPSPVIRPAKINATDSDLARTVKAAIITSPYQNIKFAEIAAGLPDQALVVFLKFPLRQSAARRQLVMESLERLLGIPVPTLAELAGLTGDDGLGTAPRGIEGLTAAQAAAATWFKTLVGRRPWPSLVPDHAVMESWTLPLHRAWRVLRSADQIFAAAHPRAPQPSFTVWRLVIDDDKPGWTRQDNDEVLATLERAALVAGLDALAALLVPAEPSAPVPEAVSVPVQGVGASPTLPLPHPPLGRDVVESRSPESGSENRGDCVKSSPPTTTATGDVANSDTLPVQVEVLGVDIVNKGGLLALAVVEIVFDGVPITLQGVQVRRHPDGRVTVDSPCYRGGDGRWLPALVLPQELGQAIAETVVSSLSGQ